MTIDKHDFGGCGLFGEMDVVSGKIMYEYAGTCRTSENKCGLSGKYFQEKPLEKSSDKEHKET